MARVKKWQGLDGGGGRGGLGGVKGGKGSSVIVPTIKIEFKKSAFIWLTLC